MESANTGRVSAAARERAAQEGPLLALRPARVLVCAALARREARLVSALPHGVDEPSRVQVLARGPPPAPSSG